jgi:putative YphP/YqiW family bacilliredoxin
VFAGGDVEAIERLRGHYLANIMPSSPSVALFRDGQPVHVMHRSEIESSDPLTIASKLMAAFDQHFAKQAQ